MDFAHAARCQQLIERLRRFMRDEAVYPSQLSGSRNGRQWRQSAVIEALKAKARAIGPWTAFVRELELGGGLSNVDYAPLAEVMGHALHRAGAVQRPRARPRPYGSAAALWANRRSLIRYNGWPHLELAGDPRLVTQR